MKAEEKAKELVEKYYELSIVTTYNGNDENEVAKQCALIAVDEIIKSQPFDIYNMEQCKNVNEYWQEVKTEIEKL